jgi:hypothetical protein
MDVVVVAADDRCRHHAAGHFELRDVRDVRQESRLDALGDFELALQAVFLT